MIGNVDLIFLHNIQRKLDDMETKSSLMANDYEEKLSQQQSVQSSVVKRKDLNSNDLS